MSTDAWSMFVMDLASYLHKGRSEVLQFSSKELSMWMVYFKVKKMVGEERADYRNAITAYTIASVFGGKKSKLQVTDFIPFYTKVLPTFTGLIDKLRNFARQMAGKTKDKSPILDDTKPRQLKRRKKGDVNVR